MVRAMTAEFQEGFQTAPDSRVTGGFLMRCGFKKTGKPGGWDSLAAGGAGERFKEGGIGGKVVGFLRRRGDGEERLRAWRRCRGAGIDELEFPHAGFVRGERGAPERTAGWVRDAGGADLA